MGNNGGTYVELLTETQYLRVEEAAREKNEYVAGRTYAMSGVTFAHDRIAINLMTMLCQPARSRGCSVYSSDVKVKVEEFGCFYYPDVSMTCEPFTPASVFITAPRLLIEVLSPSTETIDRREKMIAYRSIKSLAEYAIAQQDAPLIEVYRRTPTGDWTLTEYRHNESVLFESFTGASVAVPVSDIYDWL